MPQPGPGRLDKAVVLCLSRGQSNRGLGGTPRADATTADHYAPAACGAPRPWASRPIRIGIDVDPLCTLKGVHIYNTQMAQKESTHALQSGLGRLCGRAHEPTCFLGTELYIYSVPRKVVGPRGQCSKDRVAIGGYRQILFQALHNWLDSWRGRRLAPCVQSQTLK